MGIVYGNNKTFWLVFAVVKRVAYCGCLYMYKERRLGRGRIAVSTKVRRYVLWYLQITRILNHFNIEI